ncbi:MAG: inositol monophosphatase [Anaerolineaceae bacterium]|nr:inositol monophosphatase [Anaerolineaceae bacterium]
MEVNLKEVLSWTTEAAQIARKMQFTSLVMHYKVATELVTEADRAVEAFLLDKIRSHFPDHSINAEESGDLKQSTEHKWYIDPIDGTKNYAHRMPFFAVSVAYAFRGELQLGVICNPAMDETFYAAKGKGAFLNGEAIRVSDAKTLRDSLVITGFRKTLLDTPKSNLKNFVRFCKDSQTIRHLGSAALDLAYVACGRGDGFWDMALNPYDIAAGVLIASEAGAIVDTIDGEGDLLSGKVDVLAANPAIFPLMRQGLLEERIS